MSEGELLQIEKARKLDIDEAVYFNIIRQKTAALIAASVALVASTAQQKEETVEKMRLFGELVGIAFQMKDDLFDYNNDSFTGKPTGIDIKEQKMTLPLIFTLGKVQKKRKHSSSIQLRDTNTDSEKVARVIQLVHQNGGIDHTLTDRRGRKPCLC